MGDEVSPGHKLGVGVRSGGGNPRQPHPLQGLVPAESAPVRGELRVVALQGRPDPTLDPGTI